MRLPSRLKSTTLGDLLGAMYRDRQSGVIELIEVSGPFAGRSHRITLDAGMVASIESSFKVSRVGDILKNQGLVGNDAIRQLTRRLIETPGRRAGEILVEDVKLAPALVGAALRRQLRLKLDALFALNDAAVRFHVARPIADSERMPPLSPREFLHGRPRARDARASASRRADPPRSTVRGRERARAAALAVLGLPPAADREQVQRAFRQLASQLHPDRHPAASMGERAELLKRFSELSAAYHLLVA